jgi:hypothetical protein
MSAKLQWVVPALLGMLCVALPQPSEAGVRNLVTAANTPTLFAGSADIVGRGVAGGGLFAGGNWDVGIDYDDHEILDFGTDDVEVKARHMVRPHGAIDGPGAGAGLTAYLYEVDDGNNVGPVTDFDTHGLHTDLLRTFYNDAVGKVFIVANHDTTAHNKRRLNVNPQREVTSLLEEQEVEVALGTDALGPLQQANIRVVDAMGIHQGQPMPMDVQAFAYDSGDGDPNSGFFGPEHAAASFMQMDTHILPGQPLLPEAGFVGMQMSMQGILGEPFHAHGFQSQVDVAPDGQRYDGHVIMQLPGIGEQRMFISGQVEEGQQIAFQNVQLQPSFQPGMGGGEGGLMPVDFSLHVEFVSTGQYNPADSLWRTSLINDYTVFGDLDGDDDSDVDDMAAWGAGYGEIAQAHLDDGDLDGDEDVDGMDFLALQFHQGANLANLLPPAGPTAIGAVPEPSSLVFATMAALAATTRRRRR